jgi:SAM-dependent methyltransferase
MNKNRSWFESILTCPACLTGDVASQSLRREAEVYYQCRLCRRIYPVDAFGIIDFQVLDKILKLPEPYLGLWALAQLNSLEDYRKQDPGSVALRDRTIVQSFSRFMNLAGRTVLDIGAGLGALPGYISRGSLEHYVALDPLPAEKAVADFRVQAWAEAMPFPDAAFDIVVLGTSLDHVLCLESAFSEIQRTLKDNGEVYIWGAWFPDETFFKNVPEHRLFARSADDRLAESEGFREQAGRRQKFLDATRDHEALRNRYAASLVDQWHFRHLPLKFLKDVQGYGLQTVDFSLDEWNYHENRFFLNGFAKLVKAGRHPAHASLAQNLDLMALVAHLIDRVSNGATAQSRESALRAELAAVQARAGQFAELQRRWQDALKALEKAGRDAIETRLLLPPFLGENGSCWITRLPEPEFIADNAACPTRSTLMVLENERALGPAHSPHDDVRNLGGGRYSHWQNALYFSTSDGSDPNTNGRRYAVVFVNPSRPASPGAKRKKPG